MGLKNKEIVMAFFGHDIKKEPFLVATDKAIGEKQEILKKQQKPTVLLDAMGKTVVGETFNKILPTTELYLKAIYDNQPSKSNLSAAVNVACQNLELSFKVKSPTNSKDLTQAIKMEAKNSMKLKRK